MADKNLENFLYDINAKYKDILSETEVCNILGFSKPHFCNLRLEKPLIPFLKIGARISYLKQDVISYIRESRRV